MPTLKQIYEEKMASFKKEILQEYLKEKEKEALEEFESEFGPVNTMISTASSNKSNMPFTSHKDFVPHILDILKSGAKSKKEIVNIMKSQQVFLEGDFVVTSSGCFRYQKSLDNVRNMLEKRGKICRTEDDRWALKKRSKVTKGHTKKEVFIPHIIKILQNGPKSKKEVAKNIEKIVSLNDIDLEKLTLGVPRYYKTLDSTRQIMIAKDILETRNGIWYLKKFSSNRLHESLSSSNGTCTFGGDK